MKNPRVSDAEITAPTASATRLTTMSMAFLIGTALLRRQRQIEQLVGRLVHREAEALVEGVGEQDRPERREQQDERAARARASAAGAGSSPPRRTAAAPGPAQQQLQREADDAQREVERAEERGSARRRRRRSARWRPGSAGRPVHCVDDRRRGTPSAAISRRYGARDDLADAVRERMRRGRRPARRRPAPPDPHVRRRPRCRPRQRISTASTSSRLTVPPNGSTRTRARSPPTIAPSDAPAPISPNSRFACRVSKSELAKLHAWTGRDHPEAVHPDVEDARQEPADEPASCPRPDERGTHTRTAGRWG